MAHTDDPTGPTDALHRLLGEARTPSATAPWVMVNMVTSIDGATAVEGRSGGLGGPSDRRMFAAVRAVADAIMVGARTAVAEGYRLPAAVDEHVALRREAGAGTASRLVVVSPTLSIAEGDAPFTDPEGVEPDQLAVVITTAEAPAGRRRALAGRVELIDAGRTNVDLIAALSELSDRGVATVVCEGGPTLLAELYERDLIDEWLLTMAPMVVGGPSSRAITGAPERLVRFALDRAHREDDNLFVRYLRSHD